MKRHMSSREADLLTALLNRSAVQDSSRSGSHSWLVEEMDDGRMGSLRLFPPSASTSDRHMGAKAAGLQFHDSDGVLVIATLNVDDDGVPFEIDVWKVNSESLIAIPQPDFFADVAE